MRKSYIGLLVLLLALTASVYGQRQVQVVKSFLEDGSADLKEGGAWVGTGIRYHLISWVIDAGVLSACNIKLESSVDGSSWSDLIVDQTCTSNGASVVTSGLSQRLRLTASSMTTDSGSPMLVVTYGGWTDDPAQVTGQTQGSTTSGQLGQLALGAVTTSAPTYTTGKSNALSLDTSGGLRSYLTNLTADTAHGATFSEAPVGLGLEALSTERAVVDATDKTRATATLSGQLVVQIGALPGDRWEYTSPSLIEDTNWDTIIAPSADYYYVVTSIHVQNSDASVGTWVLVYEDEDGDEDSAVIRHRGYASKDGGGWAYSSEGGLFSTQTANRGLYVVCATTSSETAVTLRGYRTKIKPVL